MTFSFKDYLINEDAAVQQVEHATIIGELKTKIAQVMRSIDLADLSTSVEDPRSFTFIDLLEALHTVGDVVKQRLRETPNQWKKDAENDYEKLFKSIAEEAKEAIRSEFSLGGGKLPRFVSLFNNHVIETMVEAIKAAGVEHAPQVMEEMIAAATRSVMDLQVQRNPEEAKIARQILQNYTQKRQRVLGNKEASTRNRQDRYNLIAHLAQRIQSPGE